MQTITVTPPDDYTAWVVIPILAGFVILGVAFVVICLINWHRRGKFALPEQHGYVMSRLLVGLVGAALVGAIGFRWATVSSLQDHKRSAIEQQLHYTDIVYNTRTDRWSAVAENGSDVTFYLNTAGHSGTYLYEVQHVDPSIVR